MSAKQQHLLETAERLFYRDGFHATGIDRVVAEAGVARMTLYNHYPSKDALVLAVMKRRGDAYWAALTQASDAAAGQGATRILAIFDAQEKWLETAGRHGCLFMKALGEYAQHSPEIAGTATGHKRELLAYFEALLADEGLAGPPGLATQLVMLMDGATAFAQVLTPREATQQARAAAQALLTTAHTS